MVGIRTGARRCAIQALYQWEMTGQSVETVHAQFLEDHEERKKRKIDLTYFQELLHKVPFYVQKLDNDYSPYLDRSVLAIDPVERAILRLGTYELRYRSDIPYKVVINESVELAKTFGADKSHKYVNGVLDNVAIKVRADEVNALKAQHGKTNKR